MRVLVTGASGLVGKLVLELAPEEHEVFGADRDDLDVTDAESVSRALSEHRPDSIVHCAAYTDVDGAEREPERAFAVNAEGTGRLAEQARRRGAGLVYVSTDYVFDGRGSRPYREDDETGPKSAYGRSKLEGERLAKSALGDGLSVVRTGWLYGPGKGFVDWLSAQLRAGKPVKLVEDQVGSPTYASDLALALLRLATGSHRGTYHFVNRGEASWLTLGRAVAEALGYDPGSLEGAPAESFARPAPRPAYSALAVDRYEAATGASVRDWRVALGAYLVTGEDPGRTADT